jgi:proline-rich protein PRCC
LGSAFNSRFSSGSSASSPLQPFRHNEPKQQPQRFSAAPEITEFVPPEPTPTYPYPGYYLLPSGSWAAYDTEYYKKFYDKWQSEYNDDVRALEKGQIRGFEGLETTGAREVDAKKEMENAKREIQEREERKALTHGAGGAPDAPRMNIKGAKLGGRARSRHQLSTLLTEAYENREALEERIAEGRRNRKEAGNKYGESFRLIALGNSFLSQDFSILCVMYIILL